MKKKKKKQNINYLLAKRIRIILKYGKLINFFNIKKSSWNDE